jgi:hypothetical protein
LRGKPTSRAPCDNPAEKILANVIADNLFAAVIDR